MLFFRRILKKADLDQPAQSERRNAPRYLINPDFKLKASLSLTAREPSKSPSPAWEPIVSLATMGPPTRPRTKSPVGGSRPGVRLHCRILDLSEGGARIQLERGTRIQARHLCDLSLLVEDFQLTLPCHISHAREHVDGLSFGLRYDAMADETWNAYCQLLEVVALGATLRLQRRSKEPGESGYFEETYVNNRPARLSIWRHPDTCEIAAMEFRLRTHLVRQLKDGAPEYLTGAANRPATEAQEEEIRRLFKWVVQNLPSEIPSDIRNFLRKRAQ